MTGQNLPKPGGSKEIIDPYVVVQFLGVTQDRKVFKTKYVNDNGKLGLLLFILLHFQLFSNSQAVLGKFMVCLGHRV